ncbi:electron transporter SenC [Altererythrobacter sp. B11]|uniref:SCO family protein n=1 Tax=Altererythrobacter sp. B11 TaxID=2060312 RepID=UPI000DC6E89A|nr:SCO family protein [Altererythrobacter sp. B11]BBC72776.1 electron transporter SenC [Altererythrobacter sp. B11]
MKALLAILLALLSTPVAAQQFDPFKEARIDNDPGASIPLDGAFVDQNGRPTSLQRIADGRPLLLVPVLHECPNFCRVTLSGITDAIAALPAGERGRFATVAFGIDPREGPAEAADDLHRLAEQTGRAPPPDTFATTGPKSAIRDVTDALGYHYKWDERIGQYAHAAAFAVITPQGHLSRWFYGLDPDPAELGKALEVARQDKTGGGWAQQLLLVCFHYDPETGQYTPAITKILRLAGFATVLAIGLGILFLRRRTQ